MNGKLEKSFEITDAKIQFVSLVGKAANKHTFLMAKQEDGKATFTSYGRILKADAESHYVTGIVYEPMTEDTDGEYMTEEEITKACHWFAKNGNQVDLQHSFKPLEGAAVVESWVAKADQVIEGSEVKKGTWLMTVEVTDPDVWEAIEKGDITGFSMGGLANVSDEDVDLSDVEKDEKVKKGLLGKLAKAFGFDLVEKGKVMDDFNAKAKGELFWLAHDALNKVLARYDWYTDQTIYETDEAVIREALEEYSAIITDILSGDTIAKSLYLAKKDSKTDKAGEEAAEDEDEDKTNTKKEVETMSKQELENAVVEAVRKAMAEPEPAPAATEEPVNKAEETTPAAEEAITEDAIKKMVDEAVAKAVGNVEKSETDQKGWIEDMIQKAVNEAVAPILDARGLPTHLDGEGEVQKSAEEHYLHGVL